MPSCVCTCTAYGGACACRFDGLTQGEAKGRAEERAAIVAWLKGRCCCNSALATCGEPACVTAEDIENGAHEP